MHLHYNAHDKGDLAKLGELLTFEAKRLEAAHPIDEPIERGALKRQANFIFQTINGVNMMVGLVFAFTGIIVYVIYEGPDASFGSKGLLILASSLGFCGSIFALYSCLGLLVNVKHRKQIILNAIGGIVIFFTMMYLCFIRIPNTEGLLANVSREMTESLYVSKRGDEFELTKWNEMQSSLHCCGLGNYEDWCEAKNLTQAKRGVGRRCNVPRSCFSNKTQDVPTAIRTSIDPLTPMFVRGCYSTLMEILYMNLTIYRSVGYLMLILLGFAPMFAIFVLAVTDK